LIHALPAIAQHPLHTTYPAAEPLCRQVTLTGEVAQGREWRAEIGQGWLFRIVPVSPSNHGYTGWDLVIDRVPGTSATSSNPASKDGPGYPDALLLATPPYGSINQREIATTFGLRAQDAIAWQPRRFHFFTSTADLASARSLFPLLLVPPAQASTSQASTSRANQASAAMLALLAAASSGEFTILEAHYVPGSSDPAPFALQWAPNLIRVPHIVEQAAAPQSPSSLQLGELLSIRFRATLLLPARWQLASGLRAKPANCTQ
jgi:hypothetical protein